MTYVNNNYLNEFFTGDTFLDWVENHVCNLNEPACFSHSFRILSDATGYLPHLLVDHIGFWTGDLNHAMRMIHYHPEGDTFWQNRVSEIGGVASLFLNGAVKVIALSLRVVLVTFAVLSIPVALGGIVFAVTETVPLALCIGAMAGFFLLMTGCIAKWIEGSPEMDPDRYEETRRGIFTWIRQYAAPHNDTVLGKDIVVANGFVTDMNRNEDENKINRVSFTDPAAAAREILELFHGDRLRLYIISQLYNQNSSIALVRVVREVYQEQYQSDQRWEDGYMPYFGGNNITVPHSIWITKGEGVVLTVTFEGDFSQEYLEGAPVDIGTKYHFEASSVYDLDRRTVTNKVTLNEVEEI